MFWFIFLKKYDTNRAAFVKFRDMGLFWNLAIESHVDRLKALSQWKIYAVTFPMIICTDTFNGTISTTL